MKKLSFLVLIFIALSVSNVQAQSFTDIFDTIFVNVSRADATTGILYDRVIPITTLRQFSGNNPGTANIQLNCLFCEKIKHLTHKTYIS